MRIAIHAAEALIKAKKGKAYSALIFALGKETINHPNLKENVISHVLANVIDIDGGERYIKRYFDRPEVSSLRYADLLCAVYYRTKKSGSTISKWLLARADLEDLRTIKHRKNAFEFSTLPIDFQVDVTNAMKDTLPEPRIGVRARRKELERFYMTSGTFPKISSE